MLVSFPSFLTFHWIQPVMSTGYRKKKEGSGIERSDLYSLPPIDSVENFYPRFERDWMESIKKFRKK